MHFPKSKNNCGFTLLEVIVAVALIGIFTTVAIVQHATTDPSLIVQSQVLQSHIRYAQMRSMNSDVSWGIRYDTGGNPANPYYELYFGNPPDINIVALPGESDLRVRLGNMGIDISAAIGGDPSLTPPFRLSFDSWGQPSMEDTLATAQITLTLSKAGHTDEQLTITQRTGFVQ